jgi:hypothetical protein
MHTARDKRESDPIKVDAFLDQYKKSTGHLRTSARIDELDRRIERAALSLADTIGAIKRLSPKADITLPSEELRLERLICSISAHTLPVFKFELDYDADYKDLEEYVFHDIDDEESRGRILQHLGQTREVDADLGIKVLTDIDDTIYANLVDERYPPKTYYPGVLELYASIKKEPFDIDWIPVTTLSARPSPVGGTLEEGSIHSLRESTKGRLRASALSGKAKSSVLGTIETLARDKRIEARRNPASWRAFILGAVAGTVPDFERLEREIGLVKFNNFKRYAQVYPEYRFVFFGDSGQADALTARRMVTDESVSSRVVTTFIHDLGPDDDSRSPTFRELPDDLRITKTQTPSSGPGVIVFRNHIQAAVLAHMHLSDLVTAAALARVTKAALGEFRRIDFQDPRGCKVRLEAEYREDAEDAIRLLERASGQNTGEDVAAIRRQLA